MKKLTITFLLSLVCLLASAQDEYKRIELIGGQKDPVEVETDYCKLYVYANADRNGSEFSLTIDVENTDSHDFFLFGHSYDEKVLKKQKIRFAKNSGGINNIITCEGCRRDEIFKIESGKKRTLNFDHVNSSKVELPIYVAKHQLKKFLSSEKYLIIRRPIITLDIDFVNDEEVTDEDFPRLNTAYEDLLSEMDCEGICPRSTHNPSKERQLAPYKKKVQEILNEIKEIKQQHNWRERSEEYKEYKELKNKLEDIDFGKYEKYCGKCEKKPDPIHVHQCSYCNKSLSDVLNTLQRIYQKLDTGTSKSSVEGEVNSLHRAWTGGCPNLTKKKRNDTSKKSANIDDYYHRIKNF